MTYGLTKNGFNTKRLTDSQTELEALFRSVFGAGIKTTPDTQFGKLIGIIADRESSLWEALEAIYNSQYPNTASDTSLDNVCAITAITRNPATRSTVTTYLAGTAGTLIAAGTLFATVDAQDQFRTLVDVTLAGVQLNITSLTLSGTTVTAQSTAHGQLVGKSIFISGAIQTEYNGLITITSVPDADHFTYTITGTPVSPATGTIVGDPATSIACEAVNTGPIQALAGTLTQIVNTIVGLDQVDNLLDATLGANQETDTDFRTRRIAALQGLGAARLEAIRGALLQITGVTAATVFENDTNAVDAYGRPAKSIECLVQGGLDADILDTVWNKKAAGIEPYGNTSGTVVDSQGNNHTSAFSRPTSVPIYLELDLTTNANYPGNTAVEDAILAYGAGLVIGDDVIVFPALIGALDGIPGITDVVVRIGIAASPTTNANVVISDTSIAVFDTSRILITLI